MRARRQLPRVHGRDQGRARAGAVVLPRADGGHGGDERQRARRARAEDGRRAAGCPTCRRRVYKPDSELDALARDARRRQAALRRRARSRRADLSHPAMAVNLDACIQCTRCVRACREEQVNDVIGYAFRGAHSKIVFDLDDPMGESTCVACGECVQACPTGALAPARDAYLVAGRHARSTSVCPYCGVGCQLTYHVKDNAIVRVEGRDGPANHERLCVKGRFGFDYVAPPAAADEAADPPRRRAEDRRLRDGSRRIRSRCSAKRRWERRWRSPAARLRASATRTGRSALAGFGSAKGSNEEAYLFQKLVRTGFGTNNVDHCTRLCHASSVAALLEGIGSGAVSNPVMDVLQADVVLLIGANPVVNHPVAATWIKNAVKNGTQADPRRPAPLRARAARDALPAVQAGHRRRAAQRDDAHDRRGRPGRRELRRRPHQRLRGARARTSPAFSPEAMAPVCGIPAETIREVARLFATSQRVDDPVGHGHLAARARHRQRALPDRAGDADRPGRPARHRACIRCAARTTCRARPTPG